VTEGYKRWHIVLETNDEKLRRWFGDLLFREKLFESPEAVAKSGAPMVELLIRSNEGIWVPAMVPHIVSNEETPTVAVAWSLQLTSNLKDPWRIMERNRSIGQPSKIQLRDLIWKACVKSVKAVRGELQPLHSEARSLLKELLERMVAEEHLELEAVSYSSVEEFYWCGQCEDAIWNRVWSCQTCGKDFCSSCGFQHYHSSIMIRERLSGVESFEGLRVFYQHRQTQITKLQLSRVSARDRCSRAINHPHTSFYFLECLERKERCLI
jgi:hypothetical protein